MAKFKYRMQNILNIKMKLEEQAKIAYGNANMRYQEEQQKLQMLLVRRAGYEKRLREQMEGMIDVREVQHATDAVETMKNLIRIQMRKVHKAELELEDARRTLNTVMQDRKTHEKLREKAFDEFKQELRDAEGKEVDELVSYTYNAK